jgi:hypothetical protein
MSFSGRAGRAPEIRGYFDFSLGPDIASEIPLGDLSDDDFRIATNLRILTVIATELSQQGISSDQPQINKLGIAWCTVPLPSCKVSLGLNAKRAEKIPHVEMFTFVAEPYPDIPRSAFKEWEELCDSIEQTLRIRLKATSLQRLAKK